MLKILDETNFAEETQNGLKLIEFFTEWCGYCKKQKNELLQMDKVWIGQIDADKSPAIATKYGVRAYPTFVLLNNGQEVERFSGLREKEEIMNIIIKHLK